MDQLVEKLDKLDGEKDQQVTTSHTFINGKNAEKTKAGEALDILQKYIKTEPAAEQPKVEEPKVEQPKVEEPKPIVEQPKPMVEEPKPQPVVEQPKVEEKPKAPDWLFDDDSEKKTVEVEGDRYEFDDELIIKLMVTGDKELRHNIVSRWDELDSYLGHPTLGDLVALLKDGNPFIATQNVLVLQYDFEKLAAKVNVRVNSNRISDILKKMFGRDIFVYAVSRSESVRLLTAYQNLRQISKLPLPRNIKIDLEDLRK